MREHPLSGGQPPLPLAGDFEERERFLRWKDRLFWSRRDNKGKPLSARSRRYAYAVALSRAIGDNEGQAFIVHDLGIKSGLAAHLDQKQLTRFTVWAEQVAYIKGVYR